MTSALSTSAWLHAAQSAALTPARRCNVASRAIGSPAVERVLPDHPTFTDPCGDWP